MICNSTPLIIFGKLNRLGLLKEVFKIIIIPEAVYEEVVEKGLQLNAPDSILIKDFIEKNYIKIKKLDEKWKGKAEFLRKVYQIGKGESEVIALALQENNKELLIDDKTAAKIAKIHGLKPKGSLRVLLLALKSKLLNENEIKIILTEMTSNKFRLSSEVINKFWILFDKLKNKKF